MSRTSGFRPSRTERAPYTAALAAAVADGRLTDTVYEERLTAAEHATSFAQLDALVADVPFEGANPIQKAVRRTVVARIAAIAGVAVLAGTAAFGVTRSVTTPTAAEAPGGSVAAPDSDSDADADPPAPLPAAPPAALPAVATALDSPAPMQDETLREAVEQAEEAGMVSIDRVFLQSDTTRIDGVMEDGEYGNLWMDVSSAPRQTEGNPWREAFLDTDALDLDVEAAITAAREHAGAGNSEVVNIMVFRGNGQPATSGEKGNLVDVMLEDQVEPFPVTLRMSDLERVD